jgi:hypothetical protein
VKQKTKNEKQKKESEKVNNFNYSLEKTAKE